MYIRRITRSFLEMPLFNIFNGSVCAVSKHESEIKDCVVGRCGQWELKSWTERVNRESWSSTVESSTVRVRSGREVYWMCPSANSRYDQ